MMPLHVINATTISDEKLIMLIREDDYSAFATIWYAHQVHMYARAYHMLRNHSAAEEIVQECFIDLWTSRAELKPAGFKIRAYLSTAVKHRSLNYAKKGKTYNRHKENYGMLQEQSHFSDHLEGKDKLRLIESRIIALNGQLAVVAWEMYINNRPVTEIALLMNIAVRSVRTYAYIGTKKLRKMLANL